MATFSMTRWFVTPVTVTKQGAFMRFSTIAIGSASLFLIAAAVAQTAPPPGNAAQRKANQQARIARGVTSGELAAD
jgi:hypothetical protein